MSDQNSENQPPQHGYPGAQGQQAYPGPEGPPSPPPYPGPPQGNPGDQGQQSSPPSSYGQQPYPQQPYPQQPYPQQPYPPQPFPQQGYGQMQPYGQAGPVGQVRGTGLTILLYFVTFGIYGLFYYYKTHEEMKRHSGDGMGGGLALILALFVGFVLPFTMANEVGNLYERAGREAPVNAMTGLWYIPGFIIIVGPFIWFVKTNGALNRYWESLGAHA